MKKQLHPGQKLWFTDKLSNKKAVITVSSVLCDHFTFTYNGKTVRCPFAKLDNGIYFVNPHSKKTVFHLGELAVFDAEWKRYDHTAYKHAYQNNLEQLYTVRQKYLHFNAQELVQLAHMAVQQGQPSRAVSFFETAMIVAYSNEVRGFIAELSSLYRRFHRPNASIALYKYISSEYKDFSFPPQFLTSLAAAYLDTGNSQKALYFANIAYGLSKEKNEELKRLYYRLNSQG